MSWLMENVEAFVSRLAWNGSSRAIVLSFGVVDETS
jgi:hypothetical protein